MNGVSPLASSSPWDPQPLPKTLPFLIPPSSKLSNFSRQPHPSLGIETPLPSTSASTSASISSSFLSSSFTLPPLEPNITYPLLNKQFRLLHRAKDLMIQSQFESAEYMVMNNRTTCFQEQWLSYYHPLTNHSPSSVSIFLSFSFFCLIFLSFFLLIFHFTPSPHDHHDDHAPSLVSCCDERNDYLVESPFDKC